MNNVVYVMLSSARSSHYTELALESFLRSTKLNKGDEFYLVDNDNTKKYNDRGISVVVPENPQSFSKNVNDAIELAAGRDIFILSNDVIFTPEWNTPLLQYHNALLIPSCNQTHLYSSNDGLLNLQTSMSIDDYADNSSSLNDIARQHRAQNIKGFFENLLMAFYVFKLPANVYTKIGMFDERFGIGGGEDVDYRIRCIQQGISVKYFGLSYLLHFQGKSTWDGGETQSQTTERNKKYFDVFSDKWSTDLANFCLVGGQPSGVIDKYNLHSLVFEQNFTKAIQTILNKNS